MWINGIHCVCCTWNGCCVSLLSLNPSDSLLQLFNNATQAAENRKKYYYKTYLCHDHFLVVPEQIYECDVSVTNEPALRDDSVLCSEQKEPIRVWKSRRFSCCLSSFIFFWLVPLQDNVEEKFAYQHKKYS